MPAWVGRHGWIEDFEPGQEDITDRLYSPQKLYGCEAELRTVFRTFQRATAGEREFLLVADYSGAGTIPLAYEEFLEVLRMLGHRGYFIEGKIDPLWPGLPCSGWSRALAGFVQYTLMEPEPESARGKEKIQAVLGCSGRVRTEVVLALELVNGPQPEVPHLGGTEACNRFNDLACRLVKAITAEQPLVVALDDLHWLDEDSLSRLDALPTSDGFNDLVVIGAYRDNGMGVSRLGVASWIEHCRLILGLCREAAGAACLCGVVWGRHRRTALLAVVTGERRAGPARQAGASAAGHGPRGLSAGTLATDGTTDVGTASRTAAPGTSGVGWQR